MAIKLKVVDKFSAVVDMLNGKSVEGFSTEQAIEFINERIAIAVKKNASGSGERKPTATQIANEGIKEQILSALATADKPMTVGEICKAIGVESSQKVSALVSSMLTIRKGEPNPDGKVVRTEVKGKAYFSLPTED